MFWIIVGIVGLILVLFPGGEDEQPRLTPDDNELEAMVMLALWDDENW